MRYCKFCSKVLTGHKANIFCNHSCSASFNNKGKIKNPRNPDNYCGCGRRKSQKVDKCRSCCVPPQKERLKRRKELTKKSRHVRYHKRRKKIFEILGNKCSFCGSQEKLEIDHIDPSKKNFDISRKIGTYAWWRIEKELQNCQTLCTSCHLEKTIHQRGGPAKHGSLAMYASYKCRCILCKTHWNKWSRKYKKEWRKNKKRRH